MTKEIKAILDMIAYAEGTLGCSQNGYDVLNNFYKINGWTPETTMKHGGESWRGSTTASGRYQILFTTWNEVMGNKSFNKKNQDLCGEKLINIRLKQTKFESSNVDLTTLSSNRNNFIKLLNKLAPEWASLPYEYKSFNSYYGQPVKTVDELYNIFKKALVLYS